MLNGVDGYISGLPGKKHRNTVISDKNRSCYSTLFQTKCMVPYPERVDREHFVDGEAIVQGGSISQISEGSYFVPFKVLSQHRLPRLGTAENSNNGRGE